MNIDIDKWIDVVAKLIWLTHDNKIIWKDKDTYYVTKYKNIRFEISSETYGRKKLKVLQIICGNKLWEAPQQTRMLSALLLSVKHQLYNNDDKQVTLETVIKDILDD